MSADRGPAGGSLLATIVLPADPAEMAIGGIASFVRAFVRFAPADLDVAMIGVTADLTLRRWTTVEFEERSMRFYPVLRAETSRRSRVPLSLRFVSSLLAQGLPAGIDDSILQFHRPGTDLPFRGRGRARLRVVHLTTEDLLQPGGESRWRLAGSALRRLEHASLRDMDRVLVVNGAAADAYRTRWPDVADRIGFLPNFYDDTVFRPAPREARADLRARTIASLGLPATAAVVVFAGRLDGQKDPGLVVDAVARLHGEGLRVGLVMVGTGAVQHDIGRLIRRHGIEGEVRLVGRQPRSTVNEIMNAASVLAISSRYETGPTVGYEALATGLPVVTTPVGEVARIVAESGAGRVLPDRRPESMAAAIRQTLAEDADELRRRAVAAAAPFAAKRVLEPLYAWHRRRSATS